MRCLVRIHSGLRQMAPNMKAIAQIGAISANLDESVDASLELVEGMQFVRGYLSS